MKCLELELPRAIVLYELSAKNLKLIAKNRTVETIHALKRTIRCIKNALHGKQD